MCWIDARCDARGMQRKQGEGKSGWEDQQDGKDNSTEEKLIPWQSCDWLTAHTRRCVSSRLQQSSFADKRMERERENEGSFQKMGGLKLLPNSIIVTYTGASLSRDRTLFFSLFIVTLPASPDIAVHGSCINDVKVIYALKIGKTCQFN